MVKFIKEAGSEIRCMERVNAFGRVVLIIKGLINLKYYFKMLERQYGKWLW